MYNVFSGDAGGPNLFGTEPWWYYLLNLGLYFNLALLAAYVSLPLKVWWCSEFANCNSRF
jgi:alpha-1,2-mannosyltransferase